MVLLASSLALAVSPALAQQEGDPTNAGGPNGPAPRLTRPKKPPPVNLVVTVGQENIVRGDRPMPVHVVLDNNGDGVKGDLELRNMRGATTRMPYELPRGGHKEYTLFAPMSPDPASQTGASAELVVWNGRKELVRQSLTPSYPGTDIPVLLSCTGDGAGLQFMSEQRAFRVSHRSPRDMPRQWAAYEPADVVAVNGRAWTEMDEEQRRTLRTWVEHGGHAILCGELSTEWRDPDALSLIGVTPTDIASLPALASIAGWSGEPYRARAGSLLTVSGPLQPGAQPIFKEGNRPLVIGRTCVDGYALWMGFDAFRETLRAWPGFQSFWRRAVDRTRKSNLLGGGGDATHLLNEVDDARAAATALPRLPAPPLGAVIGFGVVYALIFGPLNIWMLRRLRRTVKAWLFTPSLAAGMTLIALVVGQSWGSARTVLNSVSVLHTHAGSRTAGEETLVGLFSPTNHSFDLNVDDPAPHFEDLGGVDPQEGPGIGLGWPDRQSDGESRWSAVALQLFSVRKLQLRRPVDLAGTVDASLTRADLGRNVAFRGSVRNSTALKLTGAYLHRSGRFYWVGDLAPNAQVAVNPKGWSNSLPPQIDPPVAGRLLENQRFRDRMKKLWESAPEALLSDNARTGTWLVARAEDYKGGLDVGEMPYSNRATLLLVRCDP